MTDANKLLEMESNGGKGVNKNGSSLHRLVVYRTSH